MSFNHSIIRRDIPDMIKYIFKIAVIVFIAFNGALLLGQDEDKRDPWLKSLPLPWEASEDELNLILDQFQNEYPEFTDRFEAYLWWRVGTPYGIFKFGEERPPDQDPLIRMDTTDCTSHILCNLAISQSRSWEEARRKMIQLHYKDSGGVDLVPKYEKRWHYTLDRILNNPLTVNITDSLFSSNILVSQTITLNRKSDGTEFLPLDWSQEVQFKYVPASSITDDLLKLMPDVAGIAFVKKSYFKMGIAIAHEGVLIDGKTLIHASSDTGETSAVDFMTYFHRSNGPVFDGIMVYKFVPITY